MRINITLDVAPDELPLATELLAVLRQLTDHVSVNRVPAAAPPGLLPAAPPPAAPQLPPGMPGMPPSAAEHPLSSVQPARAGAAPPAPAPPAPASSGQASVAAAAAAAAAAPVIVFPPGTPAQQQLHALIAQSEYDEDELEALARQLEATTRDPALGGWDAVFPEFCAIWSQIALDPSLPAAERSAVPFVLLLQHMSLDFRHRFRDHIMRVLLQHLTAQRPPDVDRSEFYVHAEVFAALVSIEFVPIDGAVQTMCALAKHPQKRSAGITMMGKSVELAGHLIAEKVPEKTLSAMRSLVQSLAGDDNFSYDVEYITSAMGWDAASQAAAGGGAGGARQLRPVHSVPGAHDEMIFAVAVDAAHRQFVTGGKDTYLQVWTQEGQHVQKLDLGDQYISSMDFHPRINLLLCSAVNQAANTSSLAGFLSGQPSGFVPQGFAERDDLVAVATVRALPETTGFVTGEMAAVGPNRGSAPIIRFWDMAAAPSFQALQPARSFSGHASIATALRGVQGDANLFVSGDKDGVMLLWDLRAPQHVGAFGPPDPTGRPKAHAMMITCIESAGPLVISGSTDKSVSLWDVRRFGAPPVGRAAADDMTVLKLALNASLSTVVVSAVNCLRLLDITHPEAPALSEPVVAAWPDGRPRGTYHDVKWNEGLGTLYAVGKDKLVDLYSLG